MEMKQDFSKFHAILCHDGYEFRIRCLKRAIDILESAQAEDKYEDDPVHPLGPVIDVLRDRIWKEFDEMCSQKADYDDNEWLEMKMEHDKKTEEQKHISAYDEKTKTDYGIGDIIRYLQRKYPTAIYGKELDNQDTF